MSYVILFTNNSKFMFTLYKAVFFVNYCIPYCSPTSQKKVLRNMGQILLHSLQYSWVIWKVKIKWDYTNCF